MRPNPKKLDWPRKLSCPGVWPAPSRCGYRRPARCRRCGGQLRCEAMERGRRHPLLVRSVPIAAGGSLVDEERSARCPFREASAHVLKRWAGLGWTSIRALLEPVRLHRSVLGPARRPRACTVGQRSGRSTRKAPDARDLCSNWTLEERTLAPELGKPFDLLARGRSER